MTILVLGGQGKTSSRLSSLLSKAAIPFLNASRSTPSPPVPYKHAQFDWENESTWTQPFTVASSDKDLGPITAVYLVAPHIIDNAPLMIRFIDFAREKDVKRFVLLSASPIEKGGPAMGKIHEYLADLGEKDGGFEWAVLRPTWFMQNMSEAQHLNSIKTENKIYSATNDGKVPFVSTEDIARVAFHALTDKKPHNTEHLVLGPELLSYDQVAQILSSVLSRKISHVKVPESEFKTFLMSTNGVSEEYAGMIAGMDTGIAKGGEERLSDDVQKVTGKAPRTFRDFAEEAKGCWE